MPRLRAWWKWWWLTGVIQRSKPCRVQRQGISSCAQCPMALRAIKRDQQQPDRAGGEHVAHEIDRENGQCHMGQRGILHGGLRWSWELGSIHRVRRRVRDLADSLQTLADSSQKLAQAVLRSRSMRAAARYSVGVIPKRCLKARLNGPIEP